MYDTYRYIFIGGLILAIIFLALSVFLFFFLDIRDAYGDITGSTKRKALSGKKDKKEKPKPEKQKGKITRDTSSQLTSRMSIPERYNALDGGGETSVLKGNTGNQAPATAPSPAPAPAPQARAQSVNTYTPVKINDPDFIIEADIKFVHSGEVVE